MLTFKLHQKRAEEDGENDVKSRPFGIKGLNRRNAILEWGSSKDGKLGNRKLLKAKSLTTVELKETINENQNPCVIKVLEKKKVKKKVKTCILMHVYIMLAV